MTTIWEKLDVVHEYTLLARHLPAFIDCFGPLHDAVRKVFACNIRADACRSDVIIYGLGRLCLEDFAEILFLAEHGYGYAGVKLLRGLYERCVVNEAIAESPEIEGERFFNYFAVDHSKFNRRALDCSRWAPAPSGMEEWLERVEDQYKYEPCVTCGHPPQQAWTKHGLDSLAGKLGKSTNDPNLKELGAQLRRLYLACATVPNIHIHASMFSIGLRLIGSSDLLLFNEADQLEQVTYAISQAHGLIILAHCCPAKLWADSITVFESAS